MLILNFSHPLTAAHLEQIEALTGQKVERVIEVKTQFDYDQAFAPQVKTLVDRIAFTPEEWQTTHLLINPPSLHVIAVTLLAELHGRMGYFPAILRLKPIPNSTLPKFEVGRGALHDAGGVVPKAANPPGRCGSRHAVVGSA